MADQEEGGKLGWFVAGAILGGAVALLYAPKSGKETRAFINKKTDEGKEALSETSREVYEKGREIYDKGKQIADDAADLFERGRRLVRG
ncbi:MAG TPA: YtxH domain-containing protein [Bryobacteraceae bacterium]|jgi:gas vesicle protein|nr:YtxH domain-containing protein [Bryobacteraceae bacterium]